MYLGSMSSYWRGYVLSWPCTVVFVIVIPPSAVLKVLFYTNIGLRKCKIGTPFCVISPCMYMCAYCNAVLSTCCIQQLEKPAYSLCCKRVLFLFGFFFFPPLKLVNATFWHLPGGSVKVDNWASWRFMIAIYCAEEKRDDVFFIVPVFFLHSIPRPGLIHWNTVLSALKMNTAQRGHSPQSTSVSHRALKHSGAFAEVPTGGASRHLQKGWSVFHSSHHIRGAAPAWF